MSNLEGTQSDGVLEARDLLFLSPFKYDRTFSPVTMKRESKRGTPYEVDVVRVIPKRAKNGLTFDVAVFQSLSRELSILDKMSEGGWLVATGRESTNGFTDVIISLE